MSETTYLKAGGYWQWSKEDNHIPHTRPVDVEADGEIEEIQVPVRGIMCWRCKGAGVSSTHLGAFDADQMDEMGEEFLADYREGAYDRDCDMCNGQRIVLVLDISRATMQQNLDVSNARRVLEELAADEAMERRVGA